ncbi:MAG: hypothetical protein AAF513_03830 [Pseudomonadota bacterium]
MISLFDRALRNVDAQTLPGLEDQDGAPDVSAIHAAALGLYHKNRTAIAGLTGAIALLRFDPHLQRSYRFLWRERNGLGALIRRDGLPEPLGTTLEQILQEAGFASGSIGVIPEAPTDGRYGVVGVGIDLAGVRTHVRVDTELDKYLFTDLRRYHLHAGAYLSACDGLTGNMVGLNLRVGLGAHATGLQLLLDDSLMPVGIAVCSGPVGRYTRAIAPFRGTISSWPITPS